MDFSEALEIKAEPEFNRTLTSLRNWLLARSGLEAQAVDRITELLAANSENGGRLLEVSLGIMQYWLLAGHLPREKAGHLLEQNLLNAEQGSPATDQGQLRALMTELGAIENNLSWPIRIVTLGNFEVTTLDQPKTAQARPLELLAALIALGRNQIPKSTLCDTLWPDAEGDKSYHALDNQIYRLRKLIGHDSIIVNKSNVSLDDSKVWIDCWCMQSLSGSVDKGSLLPVEAANRLMRIYQGVFLPGYDQPWVALARIRISRRYVRFVEQLGRLLSEQGKHDKSCELYERALEHEPVNEGLYLLLMKTLVKLGRTVDARLVYQRCFETFNHYSQMEPGEAIRCYAQGLGG
jgi:DNA-binding SARP family transcriptional activator